MGAFATVAEAEVRAYAKRADGTWINAHACRKFDGTIAVRVQRPMSHSNPDSGAWVELTDDATT